MRCVALSFFTILMMPYGAVAHDWSNAVEPPVVLLDKLADIFEAARAEDIFTAKPTPGCAPHECLAEILSAAGAKDMEWLATSDAAALTSTLMPRVPASITYDMLHDLVHLLERPAVDPEREAVRTRILEALQ